MQEIGFANFNYYKKLGCVIVAECYIHVQNKKIREIVKHINFRTCTVVTKYGNLKPEKMLVFDGLKEAMEFVNAG